MPELPGLFAKLRLQTKEWTQGLRKAKGDLQSAEQQTKAAGGRIGRIFGGIGKSVKGAVGQIPGIGGALTQMLTPVGLAAAAVAALGGALVKSVTKVSGLERELRPMQERSGLAAESLQVLSEAARRLGSEDGLEGVTDGAQELQLRLAEAVQDGTGPAVEAFEKLGLASDDLIDKSPEESFLAVITALQNVTNEADRKFLADELMGGASEKLSGIVNENSAAFKALTANIRENGDIVSNEGIEKAKQFNDGLDRLKDGAGRLLTSLGTALMPVLLRGIEAFEKFSAEIKSGLLPGLRDIWDAVGPILTPVLKALFNIITAGIAGPLRALSNSVQALGRLFKGDFAGVLNFAKQAFLNAMSGIVAIYNETVGRIPGVAKIDMEAVADAIGIVDTAAQELSPSMMDVATATRETGTAARDAALETEGLGSALEATGEKAETAADRIQATRDAIEAQRQAAADGEAGLSDGLLPTLDELIETMDALDEAVVESGKTISRISRGQTADFNLFTNAHREGIGDIIAGEEERAEAAEKAAERAEEAAEDAAKKIADAAKEAADAAQRETDRINSSWDRFITKQDETVQAMDEAGVDFGELIEAMAARNGVSTVEMARQYATLGVKYGDVLELIKVAGRDLVDATIAQLAFLRREADGGGGGGGGGGSFRTGKETSGYSDVLGVPAYAPNRIGAFSVSNSGFRRAGLSSKGDAKPAPGLNRFGDLIGAVPDLTGWHTYMDRDTILSAYGVIPPGLEFLAQGGIVRPPGGVFRIGEGGQSEAVIPLDRLSGILAQAMQRAPGGVRTPPMESGQMIDNRITLELDGNKWDDVHVTSHSRNRRTGRE